MTRSCFSLFSSFFPSQTEQLKKALQHRDKEKIKQLLSEGADVNTEYQHYDFGNKRIGLNSLYIAIQNQWLDVIKILIEKNVYVLTYHMYGACLSKNKELVKMLLQAPRYIDKETFSLVAEMGWEDVFILMLQKTTVLIEVDLKNGLNKAIESSNQALIITYLNIIRKLQSYRPQDFQEQDFQYKFAEDQLDGWMLAGAAAKSDIRMMNFLIEHPYSRNFDIKSSLENCKYVIIQNGDLKAFKLLKKHKVKFTSEDLIHAAKSYSYYSFGRYEDRIKIFTHILNSGVDPKIGYHHGCYYGLTNFHQSVLKEWQKKLLQDSGVIDIAKEIAQKILISLRVKGNEVLQSILVSAFLDTEAILYFINPYNDTFVKRHQLIDQLITKIKDLINHEDCSQAIHDGSIQLVVEDELKYFITNCRSDQMQAYDKAYDQTQEKKKAKLQEERDKISHQELLSIHQKTIDEVKKQTKVLEAIERKPNPSGIVYAKVIH